jgi:hypothetical protein
MMDGNEWASPPNEDLDVAHQLAETLETAELVLYRGDRHLFADSTLPDYEESAATIAQAARAYLPRRPPVADTSHRMTTATASRGHTSTVPPLDGYSYSSD